MGEVFRIFEEVKKLGDEREGIAILDGDIVELVIIDTKEERAVRLFDEENGGIEGSLRWTNESFGYHIVDIILQSLKVGFGEVVNRTIDRFGVGNERDFMVDTGTMWWKFLRILGFEDVSEIGIFISE